MQGAGSAGGRRAWCCTSAPTCTAWQERGTLLAGDDPVAAPVAPAEIWECPSLVRIDGRWVLVLSLWRPVARGTTCWPARAGSSASCVDEPVGLRFVPVAGGVFDTGPAWYAPHLVAADGRVLAWGWARETAADRRRRSSGLGLGRRAHLPARGDRCATTGSRWRRPRSSSACGRSGWSAAPGEPVGGPRSRWSRGPGSAARSTDDGSGGRGGLGPEEPARVLVDGDLVEAFAAGAPPTPPGPGPAPDHAWHGRPLTRARQTLHPAGRFRRPPSGLESQRADLPARRPRARRRRPRRLPGADRAGPGRQRLRRLPGPHHQAGAALARRRDVGPVPRRRADRGLPRRRQPGARRSATPTTPRPSRDRAARARPRPRPRSSARRTPSRRSGRRWPRAGGDPAEHPLGPAAPRPSTAAATVAPDPLVAGHDRGRPRRALPRLRGDVHRGGRGLARGRRAAPTSTAPGPCS